MTTLIGTNPDQIPVNSMLGGMAYQDPDNVSVGKITYSGTLLGNGDVVFGGSSTIWTSTGRTSLNVNGTSSSIISLSTGGSVNTSGYLYWDNLNFDIQNNTVGGWVRIGTKDYPNALIISSSGNLALGVTPSTWTAGYKAFEFGYNSLSSGDNANIHLTLNGYYNAGWKYKNNGNSNLYSQINGGGHVWYTAPSGPAGAAVTFTQAMSLDSSNLTLSGTGATKLQEGTTAQRPASPQEGMIRKNSTLGVIEGYSGGDYVSLEAGRLISRTVFTSDGTFTPNSKTKEMIVELVGGGGGSGGVPTTGASQASLSTAGGFGEYLKAHWPRSVPVAASYNVLIGTGGAGGSAGTNSGLAGGQTRFSDGVGSIAGAKGGYGGAGGVVETVFPVIRKAALAPSDSYVSGSFQEWDKLSPPRPTTIIYNSSGSVMVADLIQPFVHRNDVGVGGDFKVSFASTAQAGGNPGQSGVVVIYEYS